MSDITGTIFPMYDKTGQNRRFPETVIEAVLGLPSYLQTQFSSLANIYMPIEGIHEAKTGQEFVYRATPNTIKANLLNLDKIYGKSLAWNQLVRNPNFDDLSAWSEGTGTLDINTTNHTASLYSESDTDNTEIRQYLNIFNNHYYYVRFRVTSRRDGGVRVTYYGGGAYPATYIGDILANETKDFRSVYQFTFGDGYSVIGLSVRGSGADFTIYGGIELVDLTLLYGSALDGKTDEQILAMYEADFGTGYHEYNTGTLISNDAESLETVGRNVWDEEWANGYYDINGNGGRVSGSNLCSANLIPVLPHTTYYACVPANSNYITIVYYDGNGGYLSAYDDVYGGGGTFTTPDNCRYIHFYMGSSYTTAYQNDICINLSDESFNGQYEPYWKKDLHLGLGNFKVKSPNIWDEEFQSGYWDTDTGEHVDSSNWKCSKNPIAVLPNTEYSFTKDGQYFVAVFYDANMSRLDYIDSITTSFTVPANAVYMHFYCTSTTTYCSINKSDPAFNGRYFSHEDITITGGLKGNGDWADMIVGNKYVKKAGRVDLGSLNYTPTTRASGTLMYSDGLTSLVKKPTSDYIVANAVCSQFVTYSNIYSENNGIGLSINVNGTLFIFTPETDPDTFQDEMDGVMLDYQLAYPETYELVTPIATSLRAGTTEARISPNSYGLSAPMVCDITYSVVQNASNAGDAQYSVTAGKLLNTHKIWGQDFDGTQDVSGAMSGVSSISMNGALSGATNIDSLLYFDQTNGRLGIGTGSPAVKLQVNSRMRLADGASTLDLGQWDGLNNRIESDILPLFITAYGANLKLGTDGYDNDIVINQSHNVGIGTAAQTEKLHVAGNILATGQLKSSVATGTAPLSVTSSTQVDNLTAEFATKAVNPKSELKTGQEFVFRKTNVEWDAKSGVIKKIKGKTLAWNQLVEIPSPGGNITLVSPLVLGHKYYLRANVVKGANPGTIFLNIDGDTERVIIRTDSVAGGLQRLVFTDDITNAGLSLYYGYANPGDDINQIGCTDLTILYGNEIDGMSDAEILAKYEAEYGAGLYPYNEGTLISNNAEAVETTGVNQWDEEWEVGLISSADGSKQPSSTTIVTKNYVPVIPTKDYYFNLNIYRVACYDADKNFISSEWFAPSGSAGLHRMGQNIHFVRFYLAAAYGTTYNHDICINISNPAINGQYFPYWKRTLQLGLDAIKVVSPNVWDEEWESGTLNTDGTPLSDPDFIRSKNFISVEPGQTYYVKGDVQIFEYGADYGYIDRNFADNNTIALTSQTRYIKWRSAEGVTTYSNNITINLSDPAFNGRYFPHGTLNLEGGLKGAGSAYDYIENGKYHKRIDKIDFSALSWTNYPNVTGYKYCNYTKIVGGNHHYANNIIHGQYVTMAVDVFGDEMTYDKVTSADNEHIWVRDSALGSSGTPVGELYYELQYEEVYDLAEPLPSVYPCDQFGTERVISPVSTTPSAPFCADIQYGAKSDDIANDLIGTRDAVQPLLDALEFDGPNHAWHLKGNLYADGFVTAYGIKYGNIVDSIKEWVVANFEPKQS